MDEWNKRQEALLIGAPRILDNQIEHSAEFVAQIVSRDELAEAVCFIYFAGYQLTFAAVSKAG